MNTFNVIRRNPILFPVACVVALSTVLIGESSYWQSAGVLNDLSALRAGTASVQELRATATDSETDIHRTLLLNRFGVAALSLGGLMTLFLYLRQSLALEVLAESEKQERQRIVQVERDRLEVEVARRTAQLLQLTNHIETAREQERARLARDLHDEMGALRLANLVTTLNTGITLKRAIIENLRPALPVQCP